MTHYILLVCTCNFAAVGHTHSTDTVVGNGCDLSSTTRPMVVVVVNVWVRHGIWIIGVQIVAALWTLRKSQRKSNIASKKSEEIENG